MGTRLLVMLSAALLCNAECRQVALPEFGRLEVSAFSTLGEGLPGTGFDLVEDGTRRSMKANIQGAVATKVPYGTYALRVWAPGFRSVQREVRLYQAETSLRIQLPVSTECGGFGEVVGDVHPAPNDHDLWVKLVPLRGVGDTEVRVSREGHFLASGLDDGQYLLLVIDGNAIVHTENLDVPRNSRLKVDLTRR